MFQHAGDAQVVNLGADQNVGTIPLSGERPMQAFQQGARFFGDALGHVVRSVIDVGTTPASQLTQSSSRK